MEWKGGGVVWKGGGIVWKEWSLEDMERMEGMEI